MTPPYPTPLRAWYLVSLLTLAYVLSFVDKYLPALLIEPIKQDLGVSDTQMGLLLGPAFAILYAALGLPLGWLADRKRRTALVATGVVLWSLATAASGLARNFAQLLLARVGVGVGDAALAPGALSLISDSFPPEKRGRPVALYIGAQSLGAGLALLGGAGVLAWAGTQSALLLPWVGPLAPWQVTFLVVGVPGVLVALLLYFAGEPRRQSASQGGLSMQHTLSWLRDRWQTFGGLTGLVCVMTVVAYSQNWYPALFQRQWGWGIARYATWSGLALVLIGPLVVNLTGWWCDRSLRKGRKSAPLTAIITGTLLLLPPGILAPLMPSGELAFLVWLLNLCGLSMVSAAAPVALLAITPGEMRGQVSALFYMVIMLAGLLVGPLAVGLSNDQFFAGERLDLACALVPALAGLPGLVLLRRLRRRYDQALTP